MVIYVRDEQRRSLPEFARPLGEAKKWLISALLLLAVSSFQIQLRRRALKSPHFLASKADPGSHPAPFET